jgi:hypothetical protein
MEFLFYIMFFGVGIVIGWRAREVHAQMIVSEFLKDHDLSKDEAKELIPIHIVTENGVMYVYHNDTNEFMAQGNTKEDLEKNLESRFPGKRFACEKEDMQKAGLVK